MRCARCHLEIDDVRSDAIYCSTACRVQAARFRDRVPAELRARKRWVRFSSKKVPLQVTSIPAKPNDPMTWSSFDEVCSSSVGVGVGFVLDGDGIVCVDLDNAIDAGGRIKTWAREILAMLPATYAEVSPSGKGLHIWGTGTVLQGRRWKHADGGVEVYGTGRYLTVTGKRVRNVPQALNALPNLVELLEDLCQGVGLVNPLSSTDERERSTLLATGMELALN